MADVFRFPDRPPPPSPKNDHRATFFTVTGGSQRRLTCAAFDVATGLELRLYYAEDDVVRSQLFRGADREDQCAETADAWRGLLIEKGFVVND